MCFIALLGTFEAQIKYFIRENGPVKCSDWNSNGDNHEFLLLVQYISRSDANIACRITNQVLQTLCSRISTKRNLKKFQAILIAMSSCKHFLLLLTVIVVDLTCVNECWYSYRNMAIWCWTMQFLLRYFSIGISSHTHTYTHTFW